MPQQRMSIKTSTQNPQTKSATFGLHRWLIDLFALLAGLSGVLAFAPFELRSFAVLSLTSFFLILNYSPTSRAFWRGWLYGLGLFTGGIYWVYYSLHLFGDAVAPLAIALTLLFIFFLALYPALFGWLVRKYLIDRFGSWALLLGLPISWFLIEWIRGWLFTGFPWLTYGYSQVDTWLAGYAPLLGVYGLSFLVAASAGLVSFLVVNRQLARTRQFQLLTLLVSFWSAGGLLQQIEWTQAKGVPIKVNIVQGNIEQHQKFLAEVLEPSLQRYAQLSLQHPADLVIWPETAVPTFLHRVRADLQPLVQALQKRGSELAVGVFEYDAETRTYYNSLVKLNPGIDEADAGYRKRHLVPFGEYMPLRSILKFLARYVLIPMSDISSGEELQEPLMLAGHPAAISICFEDAFGEEWIKQARDAEYLINISNDSWFGDSLAPHQHLEIARMRSLEMGRPMLRATNTGISAFIDQHGRITHIAPQFEAVNLLGELQPRTGNTPYMLYGNYLIVSLLLLLLLGIYTYVFIAQQKVK